MSSDDDGATDASLRVPEVSDADRKFAEKAVEGRKIVNIKWIIKVNNKKKHAIRLLVISEHRLFVIKKGAMSRKVRANPHWYDLREIIFEPPHHVLLVYGGEDIVELKSNDAEELVDSVRSVYAPLTLGFPQEACCRYVAPEGTLEGEVSVTYGPAGNFIAAYEAYCAYEGVPVQQVISDAVRAAVTYGTNVLDLGPMLNTGKEPPAKEIMASIHPLFQVMRYNSWCESLRLHGRLFANPKKLKPLIPMLAEALQFNTVLDTLDLSDMESSDWNLVADALAGNAKSSLANFVLLNLDLGERPVLTLAQAISRAKRGMIRLVMNNCNLTPRAVNALVEAFNSSIRRMRSLEELNLGRNAMDAAASRALADFLAALGDSDMHTIAPPKGGDAFSDITHVALQSINLSGTSCDTRVLVAALRSIASLEVLNLSSNLITFDGARELAEYAASSSTLCALFLAGCQLEAESCAGIVRSLATNANLRRVYLDIGGNDLKLYGAQKVAEAVRGWDALHTLNVSDNALTGPGIGVLVEALATCGGLSALSCCGNAKSGKDAASAAEELGKLVSRPSALKTLQIAGRKAAALAGSVGVFFAALARNVNLLHLDVSANAMGDDGMHAFCEMMSTNATLQTLVWDGNEVSVTGWEELLAKLRSSPGHLIDVVEPVEDLARIAKKSGSLLGRCKILVQDVLTVTQRTRHANSGIAERILADFGMDPVSMRFSYEYLRTQTISKVPLAATFGLAAAPYGSVGAGGAMGGMMGTGGSGMAYAPGVMGGPSMAYAPGVMVAPGVAYAAPMMGAPGMAYAAPMPGAYAAPAPGAYAAPAGAMGSGVYAGGSSFGYAPAGSAAGSAYAAPASMGSYSNNNNPGQMQMMSSYNGGGMGGAPMMMMGSSQQYDPSFSAASMQSYQVPAPQPVQYGTPTPYQYPPAPQ